MYRITFDVPPSLQESWISYICFNKILSQLKYKNLYNALIKTIKGEPKLKFLKIPGKHNCLGYYDWPPSKDNLFILDERIQLNEFPSIVVHELFHILFPQLTERDTLKLEKYFMKRIVKKDLNILIASIFKYCKPEFTSWKRKVSIRLTKRT